ncbi:MAG: hybrid sensor histidine kinase/response regulator [Microvirga sp.]|jgi:PAS domain S-box-containing protein|nr:hybrid sensor histidine kinase/response regulator [Microvirga sp.]MDF2688801.1 hybrid sensor histidine kinase/response regulator [Microvirga sp.]MDF2973947.1 hybrid sensor histidine kinase/response regulator [Microvirga sp.]
MTLPSELNPTNGTILVVDDEPDILIALEDLFENDYRVLTASSPTQALDILRHEPEIAIIISDQRMPEMQGDEFLAKARNVSDAEAILLTGYADLKAVIGAVNKGRIMAYVPKPWDPDALSNMVATAYQRRMLARELDTERALLHGLMESTGDLISFKDLEGRFVRLNASKARSLGGRASDCLGRKERDYISPERAGMIEEAERRAIQARQPDEVIEERTLPDGKTQWFLINHIPILDEQGSVTNLATIERDITERKLMEMRLRQADKMQALGTLAGGVAHDFNNLLMAVLGSLDLASRRAPDDPRLTRLLQNATYAAERGASLTQRLLSFSRQRDLRLQAVNVNQVITGMSDLLTRTLGGVIRIERDLTDELWAAMVDPDQLELAILNLCINARDAMAENGVLTLSTRNEAIEEGRVTDLAGGDYVVISVADTGSGIAPEVLARVLEPFFTTKEVGKGTGLGLPMVYGLAQQSGGTVTIRSTVGVGTTVELYLTRATKAQDGRPHEEQSIAPDAPKVRILLVDDDAEVRTVTAAYLSEMGHRVVEAADGSSALDILKADDQLDVLIADFAMPGMTGTDLACKAREVRPGLGILLVTGYADPKRVPDGYLMLHKPFSRADLAAKVGEVTGHKQDR